MRQKYIQIVYLKENAIQDKFYYKQKLRGMQKIK